MDAKYAKYLKVFGEMCVVADTNNNVGRTKLDPRGKVSLIVGYSTQHAGDVYRLNLPPEYDQDQRETSLDNLSETSPSQVSHQPETVPHGSEGETAMDTTPNPSVTTRSGRNIRRTQ